MHGACGSKRPVQLGLVAARGDVAATRFRPPAAAQLTRGSAPAARSLGWQARIAAPDTGAEVAGAARGAGSGCSAATAAPVAGRGAALCHPGRRGRPCAGRDRHRRPASGARARTATPPSSPKASSTSWRAPPGSSPCPSGCRCSATIRGSPACLTTAAALGGWDGGAAGQRHGHRRAQRLRLPHRHPGRGRDRPRPAGPGAARGLRGRLRPGRQSRDRPAADRGRLIFGIAAATGKPIGFDRRPPDGARLRRLRPADARRLARGHASSCSRATRSRAASPSWRVPTAAPAIANALHRADRQRLRTLPLRGRAADDAARRSSRRSRRRRSACCWSISARPTRPSRARCGSISKEFLSDPRVVEIPQLVWQPILRGIILAPGRRSRRTPIARSGPRKARRSPRSPRAQAEALEGAFGAERDRRSCDALRPPGDRASGSTR